MNKEVEHFGEIFSGKQWDEYIDGLERSRSINTAEIKIRTVHGKFWCYHLITTTAPRRILKRSQYIERLQRWAKEHDWQIVSHQKRVENEVN